MANLIIDNLLYFAFNGKTWRSYSRGILFEGMLIHSISVQAENYSRELGLHTGC